MKVISAKDMQDLDRRTIAAGVSGEELMEGAGTGAFEEICYYIRDLPDRHVQRFVILAGKGNNGGDGHVIARLLVEHLPEFETEVISTCQVAELTGDARLNAERLPPPVKFTVADGLTDEYLREGTIFIDCLLGTGIRGEVREPYAGIIHSLNESGLPVIAIDIPSGVDADTGAVSNAAVRADLTITMAVPKSGLILGAGWEHCGRLRCVDIGIPPAFVEEKTAVCEAVLAADVRPLLSRLPKTAHKGDMGRVLILGGSTDYPGAPVLAGIGALRAGGGLVTVAYPESIAGALYARENALIRAVIADAGAGCHTPATAAAARAMADRNDVVVVGPGLGSSDDSLEFVREVLGVEKPMILDADGLRVLALDNGVLPRSPTTVLTPHPGEMQRLLRACGREPLLEKDRMTQAAAAAKALNAYVVLKGSGTVIAAPDGAVVFNTSGSVALASGGTGDVLTGIIAAFMCRYHDPFAAVKLGVFVHGLAAELAPHGVRNFIADDLAGLLGKAMHEISPLA